MPTGHYQRKPRVERIPVTCEVCEKVRLYKPGEIRQRKRIRYCSRECAYIGSRSRPTIACKNCGSEFRQSHDKIRFCSKECGYKFRRKAYAKWNDKKYIAAYMKAYHAARLAQRRTYQARYRERHKLDRALANKARKALGRLGRETIRNIFERACGRCVYCGTLCERLELDHLEPVSRGGTNRRRNLIAACRTCNASKGAREADIWLEEKFGIMGLARTVWFIERRVPIPQALLPNIEHREM